MNIIQITPGAGAMYCGNCLRDNSLVRTLRQQGHEVLMVPLYLPLTLDEPDESANTPIFFSGVSVYLEQVSPLFRHAPEWLHSMLSSRKLLKWASGKAAKTRPEDLGELTLSMLRGDEGNQARELDKLIGFLKTQPRPEVVCLSNLLLSGMVRKLRQELGSAVVCLMQGEDSFLEALPETHRARCWAQLAQNASQADLHIATSHYYAALMRQRLQIPLERTRVVYSGVALDGYPDSPRPQPQPPVLGFFARMCRDKGLDTLVEAFISLRKRGRFNDLKLRVGGSCGPSDEPLVKDLQYRLSTEGLLHEATFHPNVNRQEKIELLRSFSVFSVPARYGEAFGLYLVEAMAAGVPVVQPRAAAFPELIEATGGGLLCQPDNPASLAETIERLLLDPETATRIGEAGRRSARERFSAQAVALATTTAFKDAALSRNEQAAVR
jgi:glycosyltransferase involved in cell wall biosynthesis